MGGFKDFAVGEILTASDTDRYLHRQVVALDEQTGTGTDPITFASINTNFKHLLIVGRANHNNGSGGNAITGILATFNNDTGANYSTLRTVATTAGGVVVTGQSATAAPVIARIGRFSSAFTIWIPNYRDATSKTLRSSGLANDNTTSAPNWELWEGSMVWNSTAAITEIDMSCTSTDEFTTSSTFTLYGLHNNAA